MMSIREQQTPPPEQAGEPSSGPAARRKKRHQTLRACDLCRRKKIRCDGLDGKKIPCTNCADYDLTCTYGTHHYKQPARRIIIADGPPKIYTEALERRVRDLECFLQERCPNIDLLVEFGPAPVDPTRANPSEPPSPESSTSVSHSGNTYVDSISAVLKAIAEDDDDADNVVDLEDEEPVPSARRSTNHLSLDPYESRYQNKAHEMRLFHIIKEIKADYNGEPPPGPEAEAMRPHFPQIRPWESVTPAVYHSQYFFPDPDLLVRLVDAYFDNMNLYFPAFHRPSFVKAVFQDGLHLSNEAFGATLLAVCAVGSRFMSDEPRVLTDGSSSPASAGWIYFRQIADGRKISLARPTLFDVQFQLVTGQFLGWSTAPQAGWIQLGHGLRYAEDIGAHRRAFYAGPHTPAMELWKRTVWSLVVLEVILAGSLGRQTALASNQYDLPMPTPVDDAYWGSEGDGYTWRQPDDVLSVVAGFTVYVKLIRIQDVMLRTVYALKSARKFAGLPSRGDNKIVTAIDNALDMCMSQAPAYLQWNPSQADPVIFKYTIALHGHFNYLRIVLHRPYIPSRVESSHASLVACTDASHAVARMLEVDRNRGCGQHPMILLSAFAAGIILTLNLWQCRRSGAYDDLRDRFHDEALFCMYFFERHESSWPLAARFKDALNQLIAKEQLPSEQEHWRQLSESRHMTIPSADTYTGRNDNLRRSFDHISVGSDASSASSPSDSYGFTQPMARFGGWPVVPPHPDVEMAPTHIPHRLFPRDTAGWEAPQADWLPPSAPGQRADSWQASPVFRVDDWGSYISTFRNSEEGQQRHLSQGHGGLPSGSGTGGNFNGSTR